MRLLRPCTTFASFHVPISAGDRRLLIKYRPAKKAAIHLRALGLVDEDGAPTDDRCALCNSLVSHTAQDHATDGRIEWHFLKGPALSSAFNPFNPLEPCRLDLDRDGNCTEPSPRIWLGNIAPTATSKNLHAVLGRCVCC